MDRTSAKFETARDQWDLWTDSILAQAPKETWPILAGWASFGSTCAMSTWSQLKVLGVSTGTRPPWIPSTLGFATVCLASVASHRAAIHAHGSMEDFKAKRHIPSSPSLWEQLTPEWRDRFNSRQREYNSFMHSVQDSWGGDTVNIGNVLQIPKHALRICVIGLLAFKLLGGRFWGLAPSSYTHVGSFARRGIPATDNYATVSQRATMERLGRQYGCHTCGSHERFSRSSFRFVGDHMPPRSVAKQINARWYNQWLGRTVRFRFYPQCKTCSNRQGSLLSAAVQQKGLNLAKVGGGQVAHFHGLKLRASHAAGGLVAGVTVLGASNEEISHGNPRRFREWHRRMEHFVKQTFSF